MMLINNLDINKLIPYEFNNRNHDQQQIDRIANSIKEFGFNQPIVIDESNIILVGHGRHLAALKLGLKEVPVLQLKGLTETQKKAYRILDNKLQNDSTWSFDNLELELGFLEDEGFDLGAWGLDELRDMFPEDEPEVTDDEFNPDDCENDETFIKLGDLIELGQHRVMCGDSREDISSLLSGKLANLIVTDPPYGVNHIGGTKDPRRETHRSGGVVENDDLGNDGTHDLIKAALDACSDNCTRGCAAYIASPPGTLLPYFIKAMASNFIFRHSLVWVKHAFVFGRCDYHYRHELILYGWKDDGAHYFCEKRDLDTVLEYDRGDKKIEHPTSKPLELFAGFISNSSKTNELVLDPFLGSGTTLIAADQLNRICYGMEISPKYCHVIIERYKKHCEKTKKPFECKINGIPYTTFEDIKENGTGKEI